jgi:hypothetical protein
MRKLVMILTLAISMMAVSALNASVPVPPCDYDPAGCPALVR